MLLPLIQTALVLAAPPTHTVPSNEALLVTDPQTLTALDDSGYDFATVLGGKRGSTAEVYKGTPAYRDLVNLLSRDQDLLAVRDPKSGVGLGHSHRAFDIGWLKSPQARFELVSVVNRLDRKHVVKGSCGERRLVYRLAYTVGTNSSRLPMTMNVVLSQMPAAGEKDCAGVATRWLAVETAADKTKALREGPMAAPFDVLRVETNTQSVRYPSGIRPDLGGHAGYILRLFTMKNGRLSKGRLENTPTVTLDGKRRTQLKKYLRSHLPQIDDGSLILPDKFLAKRSVSVAPRGILRAANRPYLQVLGSPTRVFKGADFSKLSQVKSKEGAVRRLESMSCKGCHQSRSLAGFHMLGEERDPNQRWNGVAVGASPHLLGELPWRRDLLIATKDGTEYTAPRPFAEHTTAGQLGATCGLGDPTYAGWTCDKGLVCHDTLKDAVGVCGYPAPVPPGGMTELSQLIPSKNRKPDRIRRITRLECANDTQDPEVTRGARSSDGFPGGMCHGPCKTYGERKGDAVCGGVPFDGGKLFGGFTKCLAGQKHSFAECIADSSKPTWLRACDISTPCRKDYLCARVPNLPADQGACLPTYFLAQVRVDGHALSE